MLGESKQQAVHKGPRLSNYFGRGAHQGPDVLSMMQTVEAQNQGLFMGCEEVLERAGKQATSLARHMVAECGMSEAIGPIYVDDLRGQSLARSKKELRRWAEGDCGGRSALQRRAAEEAAAEGGDHTRGEFQKKRKSKRNFFF